jgi:hypothetical protein
MVIVFPVPSRDVTNQTLRKLLNYSRPGRVWIVTVSLGTGKTITFFYSVVFSEVNGGEQRRPVPHSPAFLFGADS